MKQRAFIVILAVIFVFFKIFFALRLILIFCVKNHPININFKDEYDAAFFV